MENNSLFPLKYRLRKTDEPVEIVAWETAEKGARSENDWVSYIDSNCNEHIKEHLTLEFDFVIDSPFEKMINNFEPTKFSEYDPWDGRRYELVKEFVLRDGVKPGCAVTMADDIIAALKKSPEATDFIEGVQMDDGYENIGIGEIVEVIDGPEHLKRFLFTDRKDIVGFRGDSGRWNVGDRVKVYIKHLDPQEEERPVP